MQSWGRRRHHQPTPESTNPKTIRQSPHALPRLSGLMSPTSAPGPYLPGAPPVPLPRVIRPEGRTLLNEHVTTSEACRAGMEGGEGSHARVLIVARAHEHARSTARSARLRCERASVRAHSALRASVRACAAPSCARALRPPQGRTLLNEHAASTHVDGSPLVRSGARRGRGQARAHARAHGARACARAPVFQGRASARAPANQSLALLPRALPPIRPARADKSAHLHPTHTTQTHNTNT